MRSAPECDRRNVLDAAGAGRDGRLLDVSITVLLNNYVMEAGKSAKPVALRTEARRHRRLTRERVLDAAEQLFTTRGFHATSMQQIAAAAGHTTGALYSSFEGKDDLFLAVLHRRRAVREEVWRTALGAAIDSPAGAVAMGQSVVPDPAWYGAILEFMVHAARNPELQHAVVDISGFSSREAFFVEVLEGVVGSSPLPIARLAPIIWALVLGFGEMWFAEPERADPLLFAEAIAALTGTSPQGIREDAPDAHRPDGDETHKPAGKEMK
jgi:AcrR family transcriptional regulator